MDSINADFCTAYVWGRQTETEGQGYVCNFEYFLIIGFLKINHYLVDFFGVFFGWVGIFLTIPVGFN